MDNFDQLRIAFPRNSGLCAFGLPDFGGMAPTRRTFPKPFYRDEGAQPEENFRCVLSSSAGGNDRCLAGRDHSGV